MCALCHLAQLPLFEYFAPEQLLAKLHVLLDLPDTQVDVLLPKSGLDVRIPSRDEYRMVSVALEVFFVS